MKKMTISQIWVLLIAIFMGIGLLSVNPGHAAQLLPNGKQQFTTADGSTACASCGVYFYTPGTLALKDTWQDAAKATLNANPVVLDALGSATIYGAGSYRQILCSTSGGATCTGTTLWDKVTAAPASLEQSWAGTSGGSANVQTLTQADFALVDGQVVTFLAGATNTGATTLNISSQGAKAVVRDTSSGPVALTGSEITTNNVVSVIYSTSTEQFHLLTPTPVQSFEGTIAFNGVISPTILAADQDDWTPTGGFSGANTVRVSSNTEINITGLTGGSSGRTVIFHNIGTSAINFISESSDSTAANRFIFADSVTLQPDYSFVLQYDSTSVRWRRMQPEARMPRGYISGCTLSNGTDTTNDIDITECAARASNAVADLETSSTSLGKQLDAAWAVGGTTASPAGMRSSATLADDTWHIFAIGGQGQPADIFAHNAIDPTSVLPTNYSWYRRVGSIIRASSAILGFSQLADEFLLSVQYEDFQGNLTATVQNIALAHVPDDIQVWAKMNLTVDTPTGSPAEIYLSSTDQADVDPSISAPPYPTAYAINAVGAASVPVPPIRTDTSTQIRGEADTTRGIRIGTEGWIDNRGKD